MEKKYQLPKAFAEKWIAALRSGKYKQSNGNLLNTGGYCCLGVACKIKRVPNSVLFGANLIDTTFIDRKYVDKMPLPLQGKIISNTLVGEVATMNDGGVSFSKIADWIEANVDFVGGVKP